MPNFFINVKEKGAKKAAGNIKSLTGSMKMMALQAVSVTAVVQGLKKSIEMSAEMEGVRRGFDNLAKSQGFSTAAFDKFKKATDGTVGSLTLMKQANNAMLLGITDSEDQMANMFDIAQRLGASLGVDTVQAVESLVTGLGRQSKLMLDNLGIMVDTNKAYEDHAKAIGKSTSELTDQERKTAFVNAAMSEANSLVKQLGEEQLTTKDSIAQVGTALGDLAITLGDRLAPSVNVVAQSFTDLLIDINKVAFAQGALNSATIGAISDQELLKFAYKEVKNEMGQLQGTVEQVWDGFTKLTKAESFNINATIAEKEEYAALNAEMNLLGEAIIALMIPAEELNKIQGDQTSSVVAAGEALAEFEVLQQAKLDKYTLEQELIAGLIVKNSDLASSLGIITDETNKQQDAEVKLKKDRKETAEGFVSNMQTMGKAYPEMEKAGKRAAQVQALVDAYASANAAFKAMAGIPVVGPALGATAAVAALGAGLANVKMIEKAATGADFVTSGPQMLMVGDNPGGQEQVSVTPLSSPNIDGPQGGSSVTVNVSGNVLSQDFVEGELAENIKEAIRRGTDFGIS